MGQCGVVRGVVGGGAVWCGKGWGSVVRGGAVWCGKGWGSVVW